jgi:CubicO group peptidase (beta-lactamase class C family)
VQIRLLAPAFLVLTANVFAQTPPLSDYAGTYAYGPGTTVEIVAGSELYALLDDAKYKLPAVRVDVFKNGGGQEIRFHRDAKGRVTDFEEAGVSHARISDTVKSESQALMRPRPAGKDSPEDYRYHPAADMKDGISIGDIAQSDLGVATANAIVRGILDGTYKDVHSVLLFQHGHLVMEEYFYGYTAARTHQLRSATKSVVSALAGIAIDRGAIPGADEPVVPHLPYTSYGNPDPRKAKITLGNFLSMSPGLDCNDHSDNSPGRETVIDEAPNWVKATMDLPMINDPGTKGFYCSGGVAVVGRAVENAVHMKLPDFAQANLFGPLGMQRSDWSWNYDLTNADKEYSQIHLRPRDMLKLGMLFADGGSWHGRQLISSAWVKTSLAEHSKVDNTSYGYFWWRPWLNVPQPAGEQRVDMMAAQGNGGQKIYLLPQFDFIGVFTAGDYNSDGAPPNRIMIQTILPALLAARAK